jgi:hypothetical protein
VADFGGIAEKSRSGQQQETRFLKEVPVKGLLNADPGGISAASRELRQDVGIHEIGWDSGAASNSRLMASGRDGRSLSAGRKPSTCSCRRGETRT